MTNALPVWEIVSDTKSTDRQPVPSRTEEPCMNFEHRSRSVESTGGESLGKACRANAFRPDGVDVPSQHAAGGLFEQAPADGCSSIPQASDLMSQRNQRAGVISKPGIYFEFPSEAYFADPCPKPSLNQSLAKVLLEQSPLHARYAHPRLSPVAKEEREEKYDKDRAIGNAAHALLLGRGKDVDPLPFEDFKTKAAQVARRESLAVGYEPILSKHYEAARELAGSIRRQLDAHQCRDAFTDGRSEVVLAWEEGGIWFRTMIDWLSTDLRVCDDLKTTGGSAAPQAVPWSMADWGWDIQAAMWERGLNILDPENAGRRRYRFINVENYPPYALTVNDMSESVLTLGRRRLQLAVEIWKRCIERDEWPGYPLVTQYPAFPGSRESQFEEREREIMDGLREERIAAGQENRFHLPAE